MLREISRNITVNIGHHVAQIFHDDIVHVFCFNKPVVTIAEVIAGVVQHDQALLQCVTPVRRVNVYYVVMLLIVVLGVEHELIAPLPVRLSHVVLAFYVSSGRNEARNLDSVFQRISYRGVIYEHAVDERDELNKLDLHSSVLIV